MKQQRPIVRPPDLKSDRFKLMCVSKQDLEEAVQETASLDNLAGLAQALAKAGKRKKR